MESKFNKLSEEEKIKKAISYGMIAAQSFVLNPANNIPELQEYIGYLKDMIDWIAESEGLHVFDLY
jgi:hypothetical protein